MDGKECSALLPAVVAAAACFVHTYFVSSGIPPIRPISVISTSTVAEQILPLGIIHITIPYSWQTNLYII
jgi:hypothetical protein